MPALDRQRFTCVDESGVHVAMPPRFGRAPQGERVIGAVPQHDGAHRTVMAALSLNGLEAVMTIAGATEAAVCHVDTAQAPGPTRRPGDMVVWAHVSAHQLPPIREIIAGHGAQLLS